MIFRRIGRAIRRVANFAGNAIKTVTKGVTDLVKKPLQTLNKVLDKLPFGNVLKGFLDKFMQSPLAGMLAGPLGGVGALLAAAGGGAGLAKVVQGLTQTPAYQEGPPAARSNYLEMIAAQHAKAMFPQMFG